MVSPQTRLNAVLVLPVMCLSMLDARGFCTSDPAALIKSQLAKSSYGHRPAVTKPKDLAKLLKAIETIEGDPNTINSLRLLALLFVRNGDWKTYALG